MHDNENNAISHQFTLLFFVWLFWFDLAWFYADIFPLIDRSGLGCPPIDPPLDSAPEEYPLTAFN